MNEKDKEQIAKIYTDAECLTIICHKHIQAMIRYNQFFEKSFENVDMFRNFFKKAKVELTVELFYDFFPMRPQTPWKVLVYPFGKDNVCVPGELFGSDFLIALNNFMERNSFLVNKSVDNLTLQFTDFEYDRLIMDRLNNKALLYIFNKVWNHLKQHVS
jgi:hypothetical protein